jgi:hypothetical protein
MSISRGATSPLTPKLPFATRETLAVRDRKPAFATAGWEIQ